MISVCIATYNGERFIKEQLDSIVCQLSEDDEIIISDDGSSDKTLEIIDSYNDRRIKVYHHEKDKSLLKINKLRNFYYTTQNFENALKNAKGDYIFLADQDDIWLPNRVKMMLNELNAYDCVMCNLNLIDCDDKVTKYNYFNRNPVPKNLLVYILKTRILGCCLAFKKQLLNYSLPFPKMLLSHDYWLGCIAITKFKFKYIDVPLHLYRRYDSNVSTTSSKSKNSIFYKVQYRLNFYFQFRNFVKNKMEDK